LITIPLQALASYTFSVTLDLFPLQFTIRWNVRGAYYTLDILSRDSVLILGGIKLVVNSALIGKFPRAGMPPGELALVDAGGSNEVVTFEDLADRLSLVYATEAELAALQ
jgi:hypothetical protein